MEIPDYHGGLASNFCTPYLRDQASNTDKLETKSPAPKPAFENHTYTISKPSWADVIQPSIHWKADVRLEDSECVFPGSERAELVTPHSEGKSGSGRQYRTKGPALHGKGTISPGNPMRNSMGDFGTESWSTDVAEDSTRDDVTWLLSR